MRIKKKNSIYTLIIFFLVISIGLGYSFISTTLGINGDIFVFKLKKIYFTNLVVKNGSVTSITEPQLRNNSTKTNFVITLTDSSDYYQFNLDIVNDTGKHAVLSEIIQQGLTEEQKTKFDFNVMYIDGEEINKNDILYAESSDTITVIIKPKDGIDITSPEKLELTLNLIYEVDSSIKSPKTVFANLNVKEGSVTPDIEHVLRNKLSKTTFSITLTDTSQYYEFDLSIINNSDVDLMLEEVIKLGLSEEQNEKIDFTVAYSDGKEITQKDSLKIGETEKIKVRITPKQEVNDFSEEILKLTLKLVYVDDDGSGAVRPKTIISMMSNNAVIDNQASQYVTSSTGINFKNSSSTTNGQGIYLKSGTENSEFPIYYYRGNVNNNVLFANHCWKIVRTTETGGTKLIYNGTNSAQYKYIPVSSDEYSVTNDTAYAYTYDQSASTWTSTNKSHNSSSTIYFSVNNTGEYNIDYTVSSESNYDKASIYFDEVLLGTYSGQVSGTLSLGTVTTDNVIKVVYSKDGSASTAKTALHLV